jgi:hypothetical protein
MRFSAATREIALRQGVASRMRLNGVLRPFTLSTSDPVIGLPRSRAAKELSARDGWAKVLLNLCERNHHHRWIDRTLVESGTCVEALRVV